MRQKKFRRIGGVIVALLVTLGFLNLGWFSSAAVAAAEPSLTAKVRLTQNGTTVPFSVSDVEMVENGTATAVSFSVGLSVDGGPEQHFGPVGVRVQDGKPVSGSIVDSILVPKGAKTVVLTVTREKGYATPVTRSIDLVWPSATASPNPDPSATAKPTVKGIPSGPRALGDDDVSGGLAAAAIAVSGVAGLLWRRYRRVS